MKSNAVAYTALPASAARASEAAPGSMATRSSSTPCCKPPGLPTSPKPRLRRKQGHHPVSGPRPAVASRRPAGALRRRDPSHKRCLSPHVHRYVPGRHRHHSSLRPALQDRAQLQAGSAPDRFIHLPFLDAQHEAAAPQQRQSASPSTSLEYRNDVKRKLHAYHVFIQAGIICQGLLQYLAVAYPQLVWTLSAPGCEPFAPASRPPSSLSPPHYARASPSFSWIPTASSARNSSPNDRTPTECRPSASPPDTQIPRKPRTLEILIYHLNNRYLRPEPMRPRIRTG